MFIGSSSRIRLLLLLTVLVTVGCDRVTKHVATTALAGTETRSFLSDTVRLTYAENTGGFLSLGADLSEPVRTLIFELATGLLLVGIAGAAFGAPQRGWAAFGMALFLGGGTSNWLDRAGDGSVVDFMNLGLGSLRTGVFNVADVAIMVGLTLFVCAEWRQLHRGDRSPGAPAVEAEHAVAPGEPAERE